MTAVAILGLVALVGATVAWTTWHRVADERRSVTNHQHALDTMRHLGDHRVSSVAAQEPAARRSSSRPGPGAGPPARRRMAAAWKHGDGPLHAPTDRADKPKARRRRAMVFVDDAVGVAAEGSAAAPSPRRSGRPQYRSPWATRPEGARHPRRTALAAAGVSAVAVAVILALTIPSGPSGPSGPSAPTRPRHPSGSSHRVVTPLRSRRGPGARATTSTSAPPDDVSPATSTTHTAAYTVSGGSGDTLDIAASGLCWVLATAQPSGALVWTGTLFAGQSRALALSGSMQVRLGAASDVTVSMDGRPVDLPPGYQSPFDMTFEVNA